MGVHTTQSPTVGRLAIAVRGVVQGVGFRPFVYNAARPGRLSGWVLNEADTVRIEVQGDRAALDAFVEVLKSRHPPQARIDAIEIEETAPQDDQPAKFEIRTGAGCAAPGPVIPADMATCAECLAEIRDPGERRYGYPFTNCTNCGPRWSIIEALPYDRPRTSMAGFEMCADCRAEYENPADRRFHAQPIACPRCGPTLELLDAQGRRACRGKEALDAAVESLLAGQIVALKGLGGFQLLVDATSAEAVALLRKRKHRPDKPLAVMIRSLEEVRQWCNVSQHEAEALSSHAAPILLLQRRKGSSPKKPEYSFPADITDGVAPGNPYLGVMLPYTPLHHLLLDALGRPIVCTSGNLSEEPMAITTEDALERLGPIADVFLTHNRPIVRPVDDSVARLGPDGLQVLRRARGFAPLPIQIHPTAGPHVGVQGSGFRDQGPGFRVQGSGARAQGSGFRVQGSGFRVQGPGLSIRSPDPRSPIPDPRFPIPDSRSPDPRSPIPDPRSPDPRSPILPDPRFPIPDPRFPIPRFPIPDARSPKSLPSAGT